MNHSEIYDRIYDDEQDRFTDITVETDEDRLLLKNLIHYNLVRRTTTVNGTTLIATWTLNNCYDDHYLIHELLKSNLINWDIIDDNQLVFLLSLMYEKPHTYQMELVYGIKRYRGEDTDVIFDRYGLTIDDLIHLNEALNLRIEFNRDHICDRIDKRLDKRLLYRRIGVR